MGLIEHIMSNNKEETTPSVYDACCTSVTTRDKVFRYKWLIKDYKKIVENYPYQKCMEGEKFQILVKNEATTWSFRIYPSGNDEINRDYLVIYLKSHDHGELDISEIRTVFDLWIIDRDGKRQNA